MDGGDLKTKLVDEFKRAAQSKALETKNNFKKKLKKN